MRWIASSLDTGDDLQYAVTVLSARSRREILASIAALALAGSSRRHAVTQIPTDRRPGDVQSRGDVHSGGSDLQPHDQRGEGMGDLCLFTLQLCGNN